jgi:hypothetical protein
VRFNLTLGDISLTDRGLDGYQATYRRDAVCSMPVTLVMTVKLSSGIFNHALNAAISCFRISFPGRSAM